MKDWAERLVAQARAEDVELTGNGALAGMVASADAGGSAGDAVDQRSASEPGGVGHEVAQLGGVTGCQRSTLRLREPSRRKCYSSAAMMSPLRALVTRAVVPGVGTA